MTTSQIKLIATDIDDTLLRSDQTISNYTLDIFEQCRKAGIKIAFNTARTLKMSQECKKLIKPDSLIVFCGALITYQDESILHNMIPADTANLILSEMLSNPDTSSIMVDTLEHKLWNKQDIISHSPDFFYAAFDNFDHPLPEDALRIQAEISNPDTARKIAEKYNCQLTHFHGINWYQFTVKSVNKAYGLLHLAKYLDIPLQNVAAFGDDYSDVDMLSCCGFGTAVANSIQEAKNAANYLTESNNNDGVAKFLEKYAL